MVTQSRCIRVICLSGILMLLCLMQSGCSERYPENYGIYVKAGNEYLALKEQKVSFKGNLYESVAGLAGLSGVQFNHVNGILLFMKDVNPKNIVLSKLSFKKQGSINTFMGAQNFNLNLWAVERNIEFDIAPVKNIKDMYVLNPKSKLDEGFYAIHFGALRGMSTIEAQMGHMAYDFVIGDSANYLSPDVMEEKVAGEVKQIIAAMNDSFNSNQFDKLKDLYRPHGKAPSEQQWKEFRDGQEEWLKEAGKIVSSQIVAAKINSSLDGGVFELETVYEKKGKQHERLSVKRETDKKLYIIAIE